MVDLQLEKHFTGQGLDVVYRDFRSFEPNSLAGQYALFVRVR
jgi:hypothetical protein